MIIKLDRFMNPTRESGMIASLEQMHTTKSTDTEEDIETTDRVGSFLKDHLIGPIVNPYLFVFVGVIGFLILLQIVSTVLLTYIVCYLLDRGL